MEKKRVNPVTELNEHDRKILDKYTKYYSNFIESNTAKTEILENERYNPDKIG